MIAKQPSFLARRFLIVFALLSIIIGVAAVQPSDVKLDLQLVWATNDAQSPDPKHKPLAADLAKKMEKLPYKWKNYFEVNRKKMDVPSNGNKSAVMSPECTVEVKNLGDKRIEVKLIGKGKCVRKEIHPLANGVFIIGGDAKNDTAWFVVVNEAK